MSSMPLEATQPQSPLSEYMRTNASGTSKGFRLSALANLDTPNKRSRLFDGAIYEDANPSPKMSSRRTSMGVPEMLNLGQRASASRLDDNLSEPLIGDRMTGESIYSRTPESYIVTTLPDRARNQHHTLRFPLTLRVDRDDNHCSVSDATVIKMFGTGSTMEAALFDYTSAVLDLRRILIEDEAADRLAPNERPQLAFLRALIRQ